MVAGAPEGLTVAQIAESLGVHRTIASRVLATLAEFRFISRSPDGRYRPGAGLATLARGGDAELRSIALRIMQELADRLSATVSLLVAEGDEAVAIAVVEPTVSQYHLAFREGSRHPLHHGSAGLALLAAESPRPGEPDGATLARKRGYAITHGEVEPGAWGLAIPITRPAPATPACLNLITYRENLVESSLSPMLRAAERIADALR